MTTYQRVMEWWRARRRGEFRNAPAGQRGRVYVKKGGGQAAQGRPEGSISARVYRTETGEWEDHGVISKPEE